MSRKMKVKARSRAEPSRAEPLLSTIKNHHHVKRVCFALLGFARLLCCALLLASSRRFCPRPLRLHSKRIRNINRLQLLPSVETRRWIKADGHWSWAGDELSWSWSWSSSQEQSWDETRRDESLKRAPKEPKSQKGSERAHALLLNRMLDVGLKTQTKVAAIIKWSASKSSEIHADWMAKKHSYLRHKLAKWYYDDIGYFSRLRVSSLLRSMLGMRNFIYRKQTLKQHTTQPNSTEPTFTHDS